MRRILIVATLLGLLLGAARPPAATAADAACRVTYTIGSQWASGFVATVTIHNTSALALSVWTLAWVFPGNQQITSMWNATPTQSGASASARHAGWGSLLTPGGSTSFGFYATYSGPNDQPTAFTLNGAPCSVAP